MSLQSSAGHWRLAVSFLRVDLGLARREQQSDYGFMSIPSSPVERRLAVRCILCVNLDLTRREQSLDNGFVPTFPQPRRVASDRGRDPSY
jgi:hypothetical protein